MQLPVQFLLSGPSWVQYRTRQDLLDQSEEAPEVVEARQAMLGEAPIQKIVEELSNWPGEVLSSHKSASQPYHKLNLLADLGFRDSDPGLDRIVERVVAHISEQGPFQLPMNISTSYGGSGKDVWAWALCDAPLIVYALIKLGLSERPPVQKALHYLVGLVRDNGFPCAVSPELGHWRGPGRKGDPCPYANLAMLKPLSQVKDLLDSPASQAGVETLLGLWENRPDQHPYIFYMGTDFCKLKAPLIWYDILHVLDVLSWFPWVHSDPRYQDMLNLVLAKADSKGLFIPESIYAPWKDWDFGQKKAPSAWITFLVYRIYQRSKAAMPGMP